MLLSSFSLTHKQLPSLLLVTKLGFLQVFAEECLLLQSCRGWLFIVALELFGFFRGEKTSVTENFHCWYSDQRKKPRK